ncbi:Multidrug resistance protein MdtG [Alphaproteobacteria bacterium SO-S41]|nr:Multidrug resistance protein MdtG [Alphaproteobacteria bacterium SO-S41]
MTDSTLGARTDTPALHKVSDFQRSYAMWLLLIVYVLNFVDRQVINILAEPIKNELGLSDSAVGAMTGLYFALFYTVLGLPIARLADRSHRPRIIAAALLVWSGFTALSGFAQNFWQLAAARIGVGIGEAGCTPPAHALIADLNPKEKRASALAFYSMGTPIGAVLGTIAGGVFADAFGWRMAFLVCGLPGVILAIVVALTLAEPRARQLVAGVKNAATKTATIPEVLKVLFTKRTFWLIAFAASIKAFIGYGHAPFTASFFLRTHIEEITAMASYFHMKPLGFLSVFIGLIAGLGGVVGTLLGGVIADRYGKTDYRAWAGVPAIASIAVIPLFIAGMLAHSALIAIPIFGVTAILGTLWYGPVYATAQSIAPPHMRAVTSAILLFVINLIGLGLGPLAVGALSDFLAKEMAYGVADGLRWALIISSLAGIGAFILFWLARRTIREEMVS